MVVEVDTAGGDSSSTDTGQDGQSQSLKERRWRVGGRGRRFVPEEQKEGEREREESDELGVGGWHPIALAVHFWDVSASRTRRESMGGKSYLAAVLL